MPQPKPSETLTIQDLLQRLGYAGDERTPVGTFDKSHGVRITHWEDVRPNQDNNWFFGVNPVSLEAGTRAKGHESSVVRQAALIADLDFKNLVDEDTALRVTHRLEEILGEKVTAWTNSGNGIHAYWAVTRESGQDMDQARVVKNLWRQTVTNLVSSEFDARVDNVFNLDRVLRMPGTRNLKDKTDVKRAVTYAGSGSPVDLVDVSLALSEALEEMNLEPVPGDWDGNVRDAAGPERELTPQERMRCNTVLVEAVQKRIARLDALDRDWHPGAGWDETIYAVACDLIEYAQSWWNEYTLEDAERDLFDHSPTDEKWGTDNIRAKWESARNKVAGKTRGCPVTAAHEVFAESMPDESGKGDRVAVSIPPRMDQSTYARWMYYTALQRRWMWVDGVGWHRYDGRRWRLRTRRQLLGEVDAVGMDLRLTAEDNVDKDMIKALNRVLNYRWVSQVADVMATLETHQVEDLDADPYLINTMSGVVDIRDGTVRPHDPELRLTKITTCGWDPEARHEDVEQVLKALGDEEEREWVQSRVGQALTGRPTTDDVMPIFHGGGQNGKSTFFDAIFGAAGDYAAKVPDKVISGGSNDHTTEITELFGVRCAIIDETPEGSKVNIQRIKSLLGQSTMTARKMRQDSITWAPTHSPMLATNHVPVIKETDKGTWRRFLLFKFTQEFQRDDAFRERIREGGDGREEAMLAWIIDGAMKWWARGDGKTGKFPPVPGSVKKWTNEWRGETDLILGFVDEMMVRKKGSVVLASDVSEAFADWVGERSLRPWGPSVFWSRFIGHERTKGAYKKQIQSDTERARVSVRADNLEPIPERPYAVFNMAWAAGA